jgi:hypothetical protein
VPTSFSLWVDEESVLLEVGTDLARVHLDGTTMRVYEDSGPGVAGVLLPDHPVVLYARSEPDRLVSLDLDTGEQRTLSELEGRPGRLGFVVGTDGEQVWFLWSEERGDLWVMDVESPASE